MALETIAARQAGAEVLGLALITNPAAAANSHDRRRGHRRGRYRRRARRGRDRPPRRRLAGMTDPVTPTGVDHVAINVADVPGGIAFYTETIGLVQNFTRPDFGFPGAWLDTANGQQVHLIEASGAEQRRPALRPRLRRPGCGRRRAPGPGPRGDGSDGRGDDRTPAGVHGRPMGQRDRAAPARHRLSMRPG